MIEPIEDDREFVQCLTALLKFESEAENKFLLLPEDPLCQNIITLRKLVRDYLHRDKRLDNG